MSWLADALLGSPVPPPNWLDPRHGNAGWKAPSGFMTPSYRVPGERVQEALDALHSCVNPPVIQGWAWLAAIAGLGCALLGLDELKHSEASGFLLLFGPLPGWFLAVFLVGFFSHDVELRDGSVCVRRWTDVWLGRPGRLVGARETVHAVLSCGSHVQLEGDASATTVSMWMWPKSSRDLLAERLERWGIELEVPGRHHPHHPAHWHHKNHRVEHPHPRTYSASPNGDNRSTRRWRRTGR
jgi:hypothetical protein